MAKKHLFDIAFKHCAMENDKENSGEEYAQDFWVRSLPCLEWHKQMGFIDKMAAKKGPTSR